MADKQDLEPLLNTQQNLLATIMSRGDSIDNKSLGIVAVDVTLLIFVAGLSDLGWWMLAAVAPPAISLVFAALALQSKKYLGASVLLDDFPEYLELNREALVLQLLADTQKAITYNQRVNNAHWRMTLTSAAMASFGAIGLLIVL
ncbi:MAG: hypothetical protein ACREGD_02130 [Candidatus Saccharimonadales bacterium]